MLVKFEECVTNSPRFRVSLSKSDKQIGDLEPNLEKMFKHSAALAESGKAFCSSLKLMVDALQGISDGEDKTVGLAMQSAKEVTVEITSYFEELVSNILSCFSHTSVDGLKQQLTKLKEARKSFEKNNANLSAMYSKHSQLPKNTKQTDVHEQERLLYSLECVYRHSAIDYTFMINMVQLETRRSVIRLVLHYFQLLRVYFHQGYDLTNDTNYDANSMDLKLLEIQDEIKKIEKSVDTYRNYSPGACTNSVVVRADYENGGTTLEGYLYRRSSKTFKVWKRRWFTLSDGKMFYQKKSENEKKFLIEMKICLVREMSETDRRHSFELVSPQRSWYLQADSEESMKTWIKSIKESAEMAIHSPKRECSISQKSPIRSLVVQNEQELITGQLKEIEQTPGNNICADCGSEAPQWASINLGILLCIQCSGIHRGLGVQFSKVRSLWLDSWSPETLYMMRSIGNTLSNLVYEGCLNTRSSLTKPTAISSRQEKEVWIDLKYKQKQLVLPEKSFLRNCKLSMESTRTHPACGKQTTLPLDDYTGLNMDDRSNSRLLHRALRNMDLPLVISCVANGQDVNWMDPDNDGRTALHVSVMVNFVAATTYLLENGSRPSSMDRSGITPLHIAAMQGHTEQALLLVRKDPVVTRRDHHGEDPLSLAVQNVHTGLITILQCPKLRESISTDSSGEEDPYRLIVRDLGLFNFRDFKAV